MRKWLIWLAHELIIRSFIAPLVNDLQYHYEHSIIPVTLLFPKTILRDPVRHDMLWYWGRHNIEFWDLLVVSKADHLWWFVLVSYILRLLLFHNFSYETKVNTLQTFFTILTLRKCIFLEYLYEIKSLQLENNIPFCSIIFKIVPKSNMKINKVCSLDKNSSKNCISLKLVSLILSFAPLC